MKKENQEVLRKIVQSKKIKAAIKEIVDEALDIIDPYLNDQDLPVVTDGFQMIATNLLLELSIAAAREIRRRTGFDNTVVTLSEKRYSTSVPHAIMLATLHLMDLARDKIVADSEIVERLDDDVDPVNT